MSYDISIIGAGPGGYVGAIRAAQLGASVALIEKDFLGGTCLNKGCIPTKAMLASVHSLEVVKHAKNHGINISGYEVDIHAIYDRQQKIVKQMQKGLEQLLKSYVNITVYKGEASIVSASKIAISGETCLEIDTKNIIIATGSSCASLGNLDTDHIHVINSDDALNLNMVPESIIIIGGGAIGIEWSRIFSALGSDVTIVEMLDRIAPACDEDISKLVLRLFKKDKVKVKTGVGVKYIKKMPDSVRVVLNNDEAMEANKVLLAVGRKPNSLFKGVDTIGIEYNSKYIKVNGYMQTNINNIYAVGDVVGNLLLAHVASHEAILAVEHIMGCDVKPVDYSLVPFVIYGHPELASVGITEEKAKSDNIKYEVNTFHYAANGKAIAESETSGFVKTIIDANTKKLLGVHIAGTNASDMIHQGVIAVKQGLTKTDFKEIIFAHPTLSESFYESISQLHVPGKQKTLR